MRIHVSMVLAAALWAAPLRASASAVEPTPGAVRSAAPAKAGKQAKREDKMNIELITLDPGHFHAALIQREHYPNTASRVHVYAPLGQDLADHLARVARFNQRKENPTHWSVEVHAGVDFLSQLQREKPGNVVIISGRNRGKLGLIEGSVDAGFHALVDKPWILDSSDLDKLRRLLDRADERRQIALDIMTERFEITSLLQRELVNDLAVFGRLHEGSVDAPAVYMESVHHLMKTVAGAPNIRPAWFFDATQQGEGLSDIGTHLVDLTLWTLSPERAVDAAGDLELVSAYRWPTSVPLADFRRVTNEKEFPAFLAPNVRNGVLDCDVNTAVTYKLKGSVVQLGVIWDWEAAPGAGDTHFAYYRGSKARIEVRQGRSQNFRTELYVIPNGPSLAAEVTGALKARIQALSAKYPGLGVSEANSELHVTIPDRLRTTHEEHFGEVARRFFSLVAEPSSLPAWEKPNMLAKYWLTTRGTELSRQSPRRSLKRRAPQ